MYEVIFRAMYFIMRVVKGSAKTNPLFLQTKNVHTCQNPREGLGGSKGGRPLISNEYNLIKIVLKALTNSVFLLLLTVVGLDLLQCTI